MKPMNLALQLFGSLNLHTMVTFVSFINERFHDSLKRQVVTYWRNDIFNKFSTREISYKAYTSIFA